MSQRPLLATAWIGWAAALVFVPSMVFSEQVETQTIHTPEGVLIDIIPRSGPGFAVPQEILSAMPPAPAASAASPQAPPPASPAPRSPASRGGFSWTLQSQSSAVFTDLSMADATHGFASAELGQVYRTTNGQTWTQILNVGFPRYWYGVHAFDPSTVFISGFQNSSGEGIARWSTNGGTSWEPELVIDPDDWLTICQFADRDHGITTNIGGGETHVTTNGGATAGDWADVLADPTGGWFAGNFTFLPDIHYVYLTGISFCTSIDGGLSFTRRPSIDSVFDGGVCFVADPGSPSRGGEPPYGWTGGGQISSPVQGWVHRTTDGGATWSGRILNPPYPIRALLFVDPLLGFAVGGNYFQGIGGIWSTSDGGVSWTQDLDTGCEMKGIDWARVSADSVDVWCAGSRSGVGRIYHTRIYFPESTTSLPDPDLSGWRLDAAPNPFQASTTLTFTVATGSTASGPVHLSILDASGRLLRRLAGSSGASMPESIPWDGRDDAGRVLPSGAYFVRLTDGRGAIQRTLLRVR